MRSLLTALLACSMVSVAQADEGMWTYDNFPSQRVKESHGFGPDAKWLEKVRLSSARLANGCSSSFVSKKGLVMTNHHCVVSCVQQLSSPESNYVQSGFYAPEAKDELQCPALELNQLVEIRDVSGQVDAATEGKTGEAFFDARKAVIASIEAKCDENERCDVVSLYQGGLHHLYRYRRFQDVRLVFAPSVDIAFFGGDPDNFNFPRYVMDVSFLRVYEDGKPIRSPHYFSWSKDGADDGELVFVSGHPGRTSRLDTVAELEYARDIFLPEYLIAGSRERGLLDRFSDESEENARIAKTRLFRWENAIKALKGRRLALVDEAFFSQLREGEADFRAKLSPEHPAQEAFEAIEEAMERKRELRFDVRYKEQHRGYGSRMLGYALALVRWADEQAKPNGERLEEFGEGRLPALKARMASQAPVYPALEQTLLAHGLTELRADLGPDDPFVSEILGQASPEELARTAVEASKLGDPEVRSALFEGPAQDIRDSTDPMILLARKMDDDGRAIRKRYETEVESVVGKASEVIAAARFEIYGTDTYPDATFSLRLSYGTVTGFPHRGEQVTPFTQLGGLYRRATGRPPFQMPAKWRNAKSRLDLETPMNFVSTNDIIGGNSGSPIFDEKAQIVGIIFDGNIYSLGGEYGFDTRVNRAVSVDARFIRHALDVVYDAQRILKELR
ncbi:MAG: S46 family peptidase [Myxococcota bacterium]